jgi:TetR/AcrR family transcriptional repressor of nem operon
MMPAIRDSIFDRRQALKTYLLVSIVVAVSSEHTPVAEKADTREKILDHAETLFQERGFNGFSYADVSAPLGVKNAAIHYHFPAKADLGAALIQRYRERFHSYASHMDEKYSDDPVRLLDGYIAIPRSFLDKSELGCPMGILEAQYPNLPDTMQQETLLLADELRQWLTGILERGHQLGKFSFEGQTKDKALVVAAALQGAMLMANAGSRQLFTATVKQIKRDLGIKQGR